MTQFRTLGDYWDPSNIAKGQREASDWAMKNRLAIMQEMDLNDYRKAKLEDAQKQDEIKKQAQAQGVIANPTANALSGSPTLSTPNPANALSSQTPQMVQLPDKNPPNTLMVNLPGNTNDKPTFENVSPDERDLQNTIQGMRERSGGAGNAYDPAQDSLGINTRNNTPYQYSFQTQPPPINASISSVSPEILENAAPEMNRLINDGLIPAINPQTKKPITMGELIYREEKLQAGLKKAKILGDIIKGSGGLARFKALAPVLARELNMPELANLDLKGVTETPEGFVKPFLDDKGKPTGWGLINYTDPTTGETKAKVGRIDDGAGKMTKLQSFLKGVIEEDLKRDGIDREATLSEIMEAEKRYNDLKKLDSPEKTAQKKKDAFNRARAAVEANEPEAKKIAEGIMNGTQPPDMQGFGMAKYAGPVRAILEENNYNLKAATEDWLATKKIVATMNGPQQVRLRQAVNFTKHSLPIIEDLAKQWDAGGFVPLNRVSLLAAKNGLYGNKAASIATMLNSQIADLVSELGTVYKAGNSSTNESLKLAAENLKREWNKDVLLDNIKLIRRNLTIRENSIISTKAIGTKGKYVDDKSKENKEAPKSRKEYFDAMKKANPTATDDEINKYLDNKGVK